MTWYAVLLSLTFAHPRPDLLTPEKAVDLALQNAFSVKLADNAIRHSQQLTQIQRGQWGPQVNLQGQYTRFDRGSSSDFGGTSVVTSPIDQKTLAISLSLPLDISGIGRALISAAKFSELASAQQKEVSINDLKSQVRTAFYRAVEAKWVVKVNNESLEQTKDTLENTRKEFNEGTKARFDVLRFENDVQRAQGEVIRAQNQFDQAKNALNNAMGLPAQTPWEIADVDLMPKDPPVVEELVSVALANRPDLKAIDRTARQLALITKSESRGSKPSLTLAVNANQNLDPQGLGAKGQSATGVLTLQIPLFDSKITKSRVAAAKLDEERLVLQRQQLVQLIELQVRQASLNVITTKEQIAVAEKTVETSTEALRIAKVRFSAGEGIQLEVSDAQTNLTRARVALETARYEYLVAFAELQRAVGSDAVFTLKLGENQ